MFGLVLDSSYAHWDKVIGLQKQFWKETSLNIKIK